MTTFFCSSRAAHQRWTIPAATPLRCLPLCVWTLLLAGLCAVPFHRTFAQWNTEFAQRNYLADDGNLFALGRQDNDSLADVGVFIGAHYYANQYETIGRVELYRGRATNLLATPYRAIVSDTAAREHMYDAYAIGDVDGDDFIDWACLVYRPGWGTVCCDIYQGDASRPRAPCTSVLRREWSSELMPLGDLNGDGFDDIAMVNSDPNRPSTYPDSTVLFLGGSQPDSISDRVFYNSSSQPGRHLLRGGGDLDGDGYDDLIAYSRQTTLPWMLYVYWGGAELDTTPDIVWNNFRADSGSRIVPDLNGDGRDDLVIAYESTLEVHYGRRDMARVADVTLPSTIGHARPAPFTGDLNHDGYHDLLAWGGGSAAVFLGSLQVSTTAAISQAAQWIFGIFTGTGLGDVNGDATGDFALAVWYSDHLYIQILSGNPNAHAATDPRPSLAPADLRISVFPNPFNAVTTISYTLPAAQKVSIEVFDLQGRLVRSIREGLIPAGTHAVSLQSDGIASGVYFLTLSTATCSATRKLLLLR